MSALGRVSLCAAAALTVGVAGCSSFHALRLPSQVGTAAIADLRVNAATMPVTPLVHHHFDPRNGLDETETAMLAVANNPDLKLLRDDLGIAHAEAFAAGLLPDPQLNFSQDFVTGGSGTPGAASPFGLGITWDVGQLLTRSTRKAAAHWNAEQVDLNLLWAAWQVVARARLLFASVLAERAAVARLRAEATALAPLRATLDAAVRSGDLSTNLAVTGLSASADVQHRMIAMQTQLVQSEHALHLLLGLQARTPLHLVGAARQIAPSPAQVRAALLELPRRRPDLLALQAGYQSQNAKLREAILQQFPTVSVGFNRARDNSAVYTSGFAIALTLPLFNRNRGNIAIARATRQRLHDDYAARLLTIENDVDRLAAQLRLNQAALPQAAAHAARLDAALRNGETAWKKRNLSLPTYLALRSGALTADLQLISLRRSAATTGVALQTLLGGDWSSAASARMHAAAPAATNHTPSVRASTIANTPS